MGATEALASFAIGMESASFPPVVVREARRHIIDCIGAALAGFTDPCARIITTVARSYGGQPESTLWGDGSRVSAHNAALANGTIAHAVDYDDTNYAMPGHETVAVLPAVLAVGERLEEDPGGPCRRLLPAEPFPLLPIERRRRGRPGGW